MGQFQTDTGQAKRFPYELHPVRLIFEVREYSDDKFECHNENN